MPRYFLQLSYHGAPFQGWQVQQNATGVQAVLEEHLSQLLRQTCSLVGCGRTDTGVHARRYAAHFDAQEEVQDPDDLMFRLNAVLPSAIAIQGIRKVADNAHARFDAERRVYVYRLHRDKDPFSGGISWWIRKWPDAALMNRAAEQFLGTHDFSSFSKSNTQVKHFTCTIFEAEWTEPRPGVLEFRVSANRFLRNMVRAMVGTLLDVGYGKREPASMPVLLAARKRQDAGTSVPAHGLTLEEIHYPPSVFIPFP